MNYADDFNNGSKSAKPKSAKPQTARTILIIGAATAGFTVLGAMAAPGLVNLLLQPWNWGATQLFSGVVNSVGWIPALGRAVEFSTRAFALTSYAAIQTVQTAEILFELFGIKIPPGVRATFRQLRTIAYGLEAPLNFFYAWIGFSATVDSWIIRLLASLLAAAMQTLVFESVIKFGGSFIRACVTTITEHRRGNVSNKTIDL